jgi:hypothetical protein
MASRTKAHASLAQVAALLLDPVPASRLAPGDLLDHSGEMLHGMVEVYRLNDLLGAQAQVLDQCLDAIPDPGGPIGNELHPVGLGDVQAL